MPEAILPGSPLTADIPNAAYPTAGLGLVLGTNGLMDPIALGTGTRTGAKFLRDDQTWQTTIGQEISYVEFTGNVASTVSTETTAATVVTAGSFTADGVSAYDIEFFAPFAVGATAGNQYNWWLYDGASSIGLLGSFHAPGANYRVQSRAGRRIIPSSASHTFSIRQSSGTAGDTMTTVAGLGGTGLIVPGYIRIIKAT